MINIIVFIVCFTACIAGAICGIGGGVLIKPILDALGILDVASVSFLSGCTVLAMTTYSVLRSKMNGKSAIRRKTGFPLAIGAAIGGILGKQMFSIISQVGPRREFVGIIQAVCLLMVTFGTLLYTLHKNKVETKDVKSPAMCGVIGCGLGMCSAFLGIGGGPINLVVLFYFFSMKTKEAAENSLYVIFYSQLASLITSIVGRKIPEISILLLILMIAAGIAGGIVGRSINKKIPEETVDNLFIGLMVLIMLVCIWNIIGFWKFS